MTNLQSFKALQANGFGKNFEKLIDLACKYYRAEGKALIFLKLMSLLGLLGLKRQVDLKGSLLKTLILILRVLLMVVGQFVLRQSTLGQTE